MKATIRMIILCLTVLSILVGNVAAVSKPPVVWKAAHANNFKVANRTSADIYWIVIHVTEGTYAGAIAWFQDGTSGVSAHYVTKMDGSEITQMVLDKDIAYHAGNWKYNEASIGIEIEGYVDSTLWPDSLYRIAGRLTRFLADEYAIELNFPAGIAPADPTASTGIIGHNQVPDPNDPTKGGGLNHHTDPGSLWDWEIFFSYVMSPVWGVISPIDKVGLLAPYIGLASTIAAGVIATLVFVKRRTKRKPT